jgi:hypothetical protein
MHIDSLIIYVRNTESIDITSSEQREIYVYNSSKLSVCFFLTSFGDKHMVSFADCSMDFESFWRIE